MATDISALAGGGIGSAGSSSQAQKKSDIDKNEFLQLLVTQLKNQDPLDPMKDEQFAVNLAQFSQLEQLVSINDKIGGSSGVDGTVSSLTGYLGHEVTLARETVSVTNGNGGNLSFDLPSDAARVQVQLYNASGQLVDAKDFGALGAGAQTVSLEGLNAAAGEYRYKIIARGDNGRNLEVKGYVSGIVSGVIPGAEPKLIVDGVEIDPSEVKQVRLPRDA